MTDNLQSNDIDVCYESNPLPELPSYLKSSDSVHSTVYGRKKRLSEKAKDYPHVIAQLNPAWRVILCRDGIQWILQFHTGNEWRPQSYCRRRDGLLRCIRDNIKTPVCDKNLSKIKDLPVILK